MKYKDYDILAIAYIIFIYPGIKINKTHPHTVIEFIYHLHCEEKL